MNRFKNSPALRAGVFLLIAGILFHLASVALDRKELWGPANYRAKLNEFYAMEEDSLSYIGIGSSHMYCTLNPLEVWEDSGISGFLLATQQQPLPGSVHFLKEALKTQSPDVVFIEGWMGTIPREYPSEAVAHDAIDPLRPSLNKLQLIGAITPPEQWPNYCFSILKYHDNWKKLTPERIYNAFVEPADIYKGYVCLEDRKDYTPVEPDYTQAVPGTLLQQDLEALDRMLELTKAAGAELVLMIAPYNGEPKAMGLIQAELRWAEDRGVEVLDLSRCREEMGLEGSRDYFDKGPHLNTSGARKASLYISRWLQEKGIVPRENVDTQKWRQDFETYRNSLTQTVFE